MIRTVCVSLLFMCVCMHVAHMGEGGVPGPLHTVPCGVGALSEPLGLGKGG